VAPPISSSPQHQPTARDPTYLYGVRCVSGIVLPGPSATYYKRQPPNPRNPIERGRGTCWPSFSFAQ